VEYNDEQETSISINNVLPYPVNMGRTVYGGGNSGGGESTRSVHAGTRRAYADRALNLPIYQTATYVFRDTQDLCNHKENEIKNADTFFDYGRYGNPSVVACESRLAALEKAPAAVLFSSGMGAITGVLLAFLKAGDHFIIGDQVYRKTRSLCSDILANLGVRYTVVPMGDYAALDAAIEPQTKLIFLESPTNPFLRVVDLNRLSDLGRERKLITVIDATFATPVNQRPIEFGVDLVVHSATKYMSGNNDILVGLVAGRSDLISKIRAIRGTIGGIPDATVAVKLDQGLKTLSLRVRYQNQSALRIAQFLDSHPAIERVYYPGLESHPDYEIAKKQMRGFGGLISFEVKGDMVTTGRFIDALQIPRISASLGGVDSLIGQTALLSFYRLTSQERLEIGIKDNLVRFAVGIEDVEDLIDDLSQALQVMSSSTAGALLMRA
jgi:cystathionine gamma-synthase